MKKIYKLLLLTIFSITLTGCFKSEKLDKAEIYTTIYPIEFLTEQLYGWNSKIKSIYPSDVDINTYTLSNKKIRKYSKTDLFIYNGLTDEKKIAANFVNKNNDLRIIDVSEGLAINNSYEELWLNPSNYLMLAQNLKNGLESYIESNVIKEQIEKNYETLKLTITEFETSLKLISQNGKYNTLIVSKDYLKFLENYGFEIISIEETEELSNDTIKKAKNAIYEKTNKYVFVTKEEEKSNKYSKTIEELKEAGAEIKVINTLTTLSSEERNSKENYVSIMKTNMELIKEELYK